MYNAQSVIDRVQAAVKAAGITQKAMLQDCGISENTLKRMNDERGMSSFYLAKIADYLNVSVDYLLGRDIKQCGSITQSNINGDNEASIGDTSLSDMDRQLLELFHRLPIVKKAEIIIQINDMLSDH